VYKVLTKWGHSFLLLVLVHHNFNNGQQASFPRVKQLEREVDHSLPSSADINEWNFIPISPVCLHGLDRDKFIVYLIMG